MRSNSFSSIKEKLQLDTLNPLYLIGVGLVVCIVLVLTGHALWQAFSGSHITLESQSLTEEQGGGSLANEISDDETREVDQSVEKVYIHVSGAVIAPGLYELTQGARIYDAVQAAGGFADNAAEDSVNLAQLIEDGSHIVVFTKEEYSSATTSSPSNTQGTSTNQSNTTRLININTATLEELTTLKGVGAATAQKIIDDREQNGVFKSKEDLKRVTGIGDKKFESLKDYITV